MEEWLIPDRSGAIKVLEKPKMYIKKRIFLKNDEDTLKDRQIWLHLGQIEHYNENGSNNNGSLNKIGKISFDINKYMSNTNIL